MILLLSAKHLWDFYQDLLWELYCIRYSLVSSFVIHSVDHSLSTRLIPAYGFGVVRLFVQPNRFTFVQSRDQSVFEKSESAFKR